MGSSSFSSFLSLFWARHPHPEPQMGHDMVKAASPDFAGESVLFPPSSGECCSLTSPESPSADSVSASQKPKCPARLPGEGACRVPQTALTTAAFLSSVAPGLGQAGRKQGTVVCVCQSAPRVHVHLKTGGSESSPPVRSQVFQLCQVLLCAR